MIRLRITVPVHQVFRTRRSHRNLFNRHQWTSTVPRHQLDCGELGDRARLRRKPKCCCRRPITRQPVQIPPRHEYYFSKPQKALKGHLDATFPAHMPWTLRPALRQMRYTLHPGRQRPIMPPSWFPTPSYQFRHDFNHCHRTNLSPARFQTAC